jgi:MFS family permease
MFLCFVLAVVIFQIFSTYPLTLRDVYHLTEGGIGLSLAINALIVVLFEMVLVHSLAPYDALEISGLGCFLTCVGFGLLPLGADFGLGLGYIAVTTLVWSLGEMFSMPFLSNIVAGRAGEGSLGRYMGFYITTFSAAFVIAPLLGTWVYETWGAHALWYGCGALGLPLWAGFHLLAVRQRRTRDHLPATAPAA